jgi:hypothetical protein
MDAAPPDERIGLADEDAESVAYRSEIDEISDPPARTPSGHRRATKDAVRRPEPPSGDVAELLGLSQALELLERLILDLADALAGHVEGAPHLVQRSRVLATEAVAQL